MGVKIGEAKAQLHIYTHILWYHSIWEEEYQGCFYYVENGNLFYLHSTCTLYDMA